MEDLLQTVSQVKGRPLSHFKVIFYTAVSRENVYWFNELLLLQYLVQPLGKVKIVMPPNCQFVIQFLYGDDLDGWVAAAVLQSHPYH